MKKILISLFIVLIFLTIPAYATNYYVATNGNDNNPGTIDRPWRTIQKAADTMVRGDLTYVRTGTYSQVALRQSGSEDEPITFQAYPGEVPVINSGSWVGFTDYYASSSLEYIVIDGFEITNLKRGVDLRKLSNSIIRNLIVHHTSEMGIVLGQCQDVEISHNIVHDIDDNGIWVAHSTNIDIHHNEVYHNAANGIGLDFCSNSLVHHNIAYENSYVEPHYLAGIALEVGNENNKVYNNIMYNNYQANYLSNSPNNEIYNNVLYGNLPSGGANCGSILLTSWEGSSPIDNIIKNNIFVVSGSGATAILLKDDGSTGYDPLDNTFDNNLYFYEDNGPDKTKMVVDNTDGHVYWSFAEWVEEGFEAHGDLGNPQFVNPSNNDFHLQSDSPAIDAGVNVGVYEDFDGNSRPQGSGYDIGAYEFTGSVTTTTTIIPGEFMVTNFECNSISSGCHRCTLSYTPTSSDKAVMFLFADADGRVRKGSLENINTGTTQLSTTFCCDSLTGTHKISYWVYSDQFMSDLITYSVGSQRQEVVC